MVSFDDAKIGVDENRMYELFHSGVSLNCKIYTFMDWKTKTEKIHYWVTNGSCLEIFNSKRVLIRHINIFPEDDLKIKISGIKIIVECNKVVIWGRNSFIVLNITEDIYDIDPLKFANLALANTEVENHSFTSYESLETTDDNAHRIYKQSVHNLKTRTKIINNWITDAEYKDSKVYLLSCYNEVFVWCTNSNSFHHKVKLQKLNCISYKGTLKLSENKLTVISPTVTEGCHIWNIELNSSKVSYLYKLDDSAHYGIVFDSQIDDDFKFLITCSDDRCINLYNFETGKLVNKIYGHRARVWSLRFVYDNNKNLFGIISCSEDCRFILWKFNHDYTVLNKYVTHEVTQIKNCWSLDYKNDQVLTCGNDGRVKVTNVFVNKLDKSVFSLDLILSNNQFLKEMIKCGNKFVCLTNTGSLIYINELGKYSTADIELMSPNPLVKLVCINNNLFLAFDKKSTVYIFSIKGNIINLFFGFEIKELTKVLSLHVVFQEKSVFYFIADSPNKRECFVLYSVDLTLKSCKLEKALPKTQPNIKQPITITSASLSLKPFNLILGTSNGNVLFFEDNNLFNYKILSADKNNEPIVSIKFIGETYKAKPLFLIAKRTEYLIITEDVTLLTNNSSVKIETADYSHEEGVVLYGIKDSYYIKQLEAKNFIKDQFNVKAYNQIFKSENGWCATVSKVGSCKFKVTIKVFVDKNELDDLICEGSHGREIRSVTWMNYCNSRNELSFITASEDTTLKLYSLSIEPINKPSVGSIPVLDKHKKHEIFKFKSIVPKQQLTYRFHVSGIQSTGMIACGDLLGSNKYLISTSAKEELFFSKLFFTDQGSKSLAIVGKLPTTKDLYNKEVTAELRVTSFAYDSKKNLLFTCYSNSMIRSWKLLETEKNQIKCIFIEELFYKTCTIFKSIVSDGLLIIGTSDGHITSYKISEEEKLKFNHTLLVHQSGVTSMDAVGVDNIVTGGDDNSIVLLQINKDKQFVVKRKIIKAANSAITDIKAVNASQFIAVSTDQIVSLYSTKQFNSSAVDQKDDSGTNYQFTTVADTQAIDVSEDLCLIGGLGLSIWKIHKTQTF